MLAEQVQREPNLDVRLDKWHLTPGASLTKYMEEISSADFCVVVCTPKYAIKANGRSAGAGYEAQIITAEILRGTPREKFVPVIRQGTFDDAFPTALGASLAIDFRRDDEFRDKLERLLRTLTGQPLYIPPPKGPATPLPPAPHSIPAFGRSPSASKAEELEVTILPVRDLNWAYLGDENKHIGGAEFSFSIDVRLFIRPAPIVILSFRAWYFSPIGARCHSLRNVSIYINGSIQSTLANLETFSQPFSSPDGSLHVRYGAKLRPPVGEQTPADCEFGDLHIVVSLFRHGREVEIERFFRFKPGGILVPIENIRSPPYLSDLSIAKHHSEGSITTAEYAQVSNIAHVERFLIVNFSSYGGRYSVSKETVRVLEKLKRLDLKLEESLC